MTDVKVMITVMTILHCSFDNALFLFSLVTFILFKKDIRKISILMVPRDEREVIEVRDIKNIFKQVTRLAHVEILSRSQFSGVATFPEANPLNDGELIEALQGRGWGGNKARTTSLISRVRRS